MATLSWLAFALAGFAQSDGTGALDPAKDDRLNQRVHLRFASVPLTDLLLRISQRTGIRLEADRPVREYRACLYAPDRPLHEALTMLAHAFGYAWRRIEEPQKPPRYLLYDPNPPQNKISTDAAKRTVETLRQLLPEVCEYLKTPVAQRMEALYRYAVEEGGRPPQFENEEQAQAWSRRVIKLFAGTTPYSVGAWHALCQFTERDWQRLQRGERILLSSKRTPHLQNALTDWTFIAAEQARINYERLSRQADDQWHQEWQLAQEKFPKADELRVSLRLDPATGKLYAATVVFAEGENIVPYSMNNRGADWEITPPTDFVRRRPVAPPPWSLPDHPAFKKSLPTFKEPGPEDDWFSWLGELLTQAAEASQLLLAAEVYPLLTDSSQLYQWGEYFPKQYTWQTIAELLREWGYRLVLKEGGWVVVSSDLREATRAYDIPQPTLARWLYKPNRRGVLTLDECAEIVSLSPRQIDNLYMYVQSYYYRMERLLPWFEEAKLSNVSYLCGGLPYAQGTMVHLSAPLRDREEYLIMRLYARLSPAQRALLRRGAPIAFTSLDTESQELFLAAFAGGSLLLFDDYWLPEAALRERAQTATLQLSSTLRTNPGIVVPDALKKRNDRNELIQWLQTPENRQKYWQLAAVRKRVWLFTLRWGDKEKTIEIPMAHPVELEGGL